MWLLGLTLAGLANIEAFIQSRNRTASIEEKQTATDSESQGTESQGNESESTE